MVNLARHLKMTVDEYLILEDHSDVRHEFVDGQLFPLVAATGVHDIITTNLHRLIRRHVRGTSCQTFMGDMKVKVAGSNSFYYPDIMVTCEESPPETPYRSSPLLLCEIMSATTRSVDTREKRIAYRLLGGLREYIIVHQNERCTEQYKRNSSDGWEIVIEQDSGDLVVGGLPEPLVVSLDDIYADCDI